MNEVILICLALGAVALCVLERIAERRKKVQKEEGKNEEDESPPR